MRQTCLEGCCTVADVPFFFVNDNRLDICLRIHGQLPGLSTGPCTTVAFTHFDAWAYVHEPDQSPTDQVRPRDPGVAMPDLPPRRVYAQVRLEFYGLIRSSSDFNQIFIPSPFPNRALPNISF